MNELQEAIDDLEYENPQLLENSIIAIKQLIEDDIYIDRVDIIDKIAQAGNIISSPDYSGSCIRMLFEKYSNLDPYVIPSLFSFIEHHYSNDEEDVIIIISLLISKSNVACRKLASTSLISRIIFNLYSIIDSYFISASDTKDGDDAYNRLVYYFPLIESIFKKPSFFDQFLPVLSSSVIRFLLESDMFSNSAMSVIANATEERVVLLFFKPDVVKYVFLHVNETVSLRIVSNWIDKIDDLTYLISMGLFSIDLNCKQLTRAGRFEWSKVVIGLANKGPAFAKMLFESPLALNIFPFINEQAYDTSRNLTLAICSAINYLDMFIVDEVLSVVPNIVETLDYAFCSNESDFVEKALRAFDEICSLGESGNGRMRYMQVFEEINEKSWRDLLDDLQCEITPLIENLLQSIQTRLEEIFGQ